MMNFCMKLINLNADTATGNLSRDGGTHWHVTRARFRYYDLYDYDSTYVPHADVDHDGVNRAQGGSKTASSFA